jgi:murein DD-endopeptidase MepM/ murein hydrolase activator NlpD
LPSPPNEQRKVDVGRTIGEINEILGGWVRTYYQVGRIVLASFAMPAITTAQPLSPLADLAPGAVCPLDRVAIVRGSDSEAKQDGGFYAERKNGIHGAVDLNGSLGEPVYAVANGKVLVAARSDWGRLGRIVVVDHRDAAIPVYGHLNSVEVNVNSDVTAGQPIGTIGHSGNAAGLQKKNLPPHPHFAYFRNVTGVDGRVVPLARNGDSGYRQSTPGGQAPACWADPLPPRATSNAFDFDHLR